MAKELIKMRQIRSKRISIKSELKANSEIAVVLRQKITNGWDKPQEESAVRACAEMLSNVRESINREQMALRILKRELRAYNHAYDLRLSKKTNC